MTSALVFAIALQGTAQQPLGRMMVIGKEDTPESMIVMVRDARLDVPKIGPKDKLEYEYVTTGYAASPPDAPGNHPIRFRVFSQLRGKSDPSPYACRMLLHLWKYVNQRLKLDHAQQYNNRIVDLYLSWAGTAGGEQLFTEEMEGERLRKVNVMYIYDVASFTDPVEMAREVAHEYGHAILPPVGGFKSPEDWGNGYWGEAMFLKGMRDQLKSGAIKPEDVMNASLKGLEAWVATHADPKAEKVYLNGPNFAALKGEGSMNDYIGLQLYAQEILGDAIFARAIRLTGSTKAEDVPAAIVEAATQAGAAVLSIPAKYHAKDIWIPLGNGTVKGANVLKRSGDWAQVKLLTPATVTIKYPSGN